MGVLSKKQEVAARSFLNRRLLKQCRQVDLAAHMKVSQGLISRVSSGARPASFDFCQKMSDYSGIPLVELLGMEIARQEVPTLSEIRGYLKAEKEARRVLPGVEEDLWEQARDTVVRPLPPEMTPLLLIKLVSWLMEAYEVHDHKVAR